MVSILHMHSSFPLLNKRHVCMQTTLRWSSLIWASRSLFSLSKQARFASKQAARSEADASSQLFSLSPTVESVEHSELEDVLFSSDLDCDSWCLPGQVGLVNDWWGRWDFNAIRKRVSSSWSFSQEFEINVHKASLRGPKLWFTTVGEEKYLDSCSVFDMIRAWNQYYFLNRNRSD